MVTSQEARILARLATFPPSLETSWDVPREICLPGLAEYLGVVRSALHEPLKQLLDKDFIVERKTHVIGGGSRRRKVYHITDTGRSECVGFESHPKKTDGELLGTYPQGCVIHGRNKLIEEILEKKKVIITGLPGIGKTSILRNLADSYVSQGKTVRFASANAFKDLRELFSDWEFKFTNEKSVINSCKNDVLIIDELQEISSRHLSGVKSFCEKANFIVMASRSPLPFSEGFEVIEVPPLEISDAVAILPEHLENKELIAERLGGHPLALQMHDETSELPEAGTDLQNWIKDVVISDLGEEIKALDELALLPVPVPTNLLQHEQHLLELDDYALLRWAEKDVELHHLVRNVRSLMLSESDHRNAANHWNNLDGDLARLVEMYHILHSGGDIESHLMRNAESLMIRSSAGLASLIGDAIYRTPTPTLHRISARIAIERGEIEIARQHLLECESSELQFLLSILEGDTNPVVPENADFHLLIAEAARRIDDRLPTEPPSHDIHELLEKIDLSKADESLKKVILVAIAHVRHAWYLSNQMYGEAKQVRDNLEALSHSGDPQIVALKLRAKIDQTAKNSSSFDELIEESFVDNGLRSKMNQLSILEKLEGERAISVLNRIEIPTIDAQTNLAAARRISAKIWYYRAIFGTHNRLSSMAEAISLWKSALCPNAALKATEKMHKML